MKISRSSCLVDEDERAQLSKKWNFDKLPLTGITKINHGNKLKMYQNRFAILCNILPWHF